MSLEITLSSKDFMRLMRWGRKYKVSDWDEEDDNLYHKLEVMGTAVAEYEGYKKA